MGNRSTQQKKIITPLFLLPYILPAPIMDFPIMEARKNKNCMFCRDRTDRVCTCTCDLCGRMIVTQKDGVWFCYDCPKK
jgi:hypothetical protein